MQEHTITYITVELKPVVVTIVNFNSWAIADATVTVNRNNTTHITIITIFFKVVTIRNIIIIDATTITVHRDLSLLVIAYT